MRMNRLISNLLISTLLIGSIAIQAQAKEIEFKLEYLGTYESNVYHAPELAGEQSGMLNVVNVEVSYKNRVSRRFQFEATAFSDLDLYPSYSNRNKSSIGIEIKPTWFHNRRGRFVFAGSLSRRNKDLVDDAGNTQTRTLQKWDIDIQLLHKYDFGRFEIETYGGYSNINYDEILGFRSYDYHVWSSGIDAEYTFSKKVKGWLTLRGESRAYEERKTYSVARGASLLSPFDIRQFNEYEAKSRIKWEFVRDNDVSLQVSFVDRNENFENFYGYTSIESRLSVDLRPFQRDRLKASARLRGKDYDNYWTSRIGILNTVEVDYADFKVENMYELNPHVDLVLFFRSYDKTSNDIIFGYNDITLGGGFTVEY